MAPRPRFEKLEPARQEEILQAAAAEFSANGYEAASLNGILGTASVSKGAFYYYFDDKADLFVTVLRKATTDLFTAVDLDLDTLETGTFWATLKALSWQLLALAEEHPHLMGIGKAFYRLPVAMRTEGDIGELLAEQGQFLQQLLERGQVLGVIRTDLPTEMLVELAAAVDLVFDRWAVEHWSESREEVVRLMETFFQIQRGLLGPPRIDETDVEAHQT